MGVEVLSRIRHTLSQHVSGSSLAGDGLLVRIRSASIAMLAGVTAIGLGLVVFISQQGWPEVFSGPIPASPRAAVVHNDTIALSPAGSGGTVAAGPSRGASLRSSSASPQHAPAAGAPGSALAGSRQVSAQGPAVHAAPIAPEPSPAPSVPSPAPAPAPAAPAQPPAASPVPTPASTPVVGTGSGNGPQSAASNPLGEIAEGGASEDDDGKGGHGWRYHGSPQSLLGGSVDGESPGRSHSHSHSQQPKEALPSPSEYQPPAPAQIPALPSAGRSEEGKDWSAYRDVGKPGWGRH
jgi:hypothetical protein